MSRSSAVFKTDNGERRAGLSTSSTQHHFQSTPGLFSSNARITQQQQQSFISKTNHDNMKRTLRLFLVLLAFGRAHPRRPHIVFIMADDLGWNDVGFHGSDEIPTPNIDALAYSGLILNNYYVEPICTPSRSALMTGKYPIHTGMQHTVLYGAEPRGLPLTEKLLPEYLKDLGYVNRMVGKWHLGSYKRVYTPTYRGFDSHLGCWTGHIDYNDHTAQEKPGWGLDMRRNLEVASDLHGVYVTDLYTNEATKLIEEHNRTKPLFLYLAHNAVHSGNPYNPLAAPDALVANFLNISSYERGKFAAMMTKVDESVGKVVKALEKNGMLEDSVIIFSSDNGGPAAGFNLNAASNWPLKGVKNTLWEGGIRAAGFLWSPLLDKPKRVAHQMMHITDWLPTLYSLAGGNPKDLHRLDGFDLWKELSNDRDSKRETILHNIDDIYGSSSIVTGDWKLIKGTNYEGEWDNWYGPSGRGGSYDVRKIQNSETGIVLEKLGRGLNPEEVMRLRSQADVKCPKVAKETPCWPLESPCLFYLKADPCERNNLALEYPNILRHLLASLEQYNRTALSPGNLPLDLRGDPKYWSNVWTNFGDYI